MQISTGKTGRVDEGRVCKSVQGRRGGWMKGEYANQYREDGEQISTGKTDEGRVCKSVQGRRGGWMEGE